MGRKPTVSHARAEQLELQCLDSGLPWASANDWRMATAGSVSQCGSHEGSRLCSFTLMHSTASGSLARVPTKGSRRLFSLNPRRGCLCCSFMLMHREQRACHVTHPPLHAPFAGSAVEHSRLG